MSYELITMMNKLNRDNIAANYEKMEAEKTILYTKREAQKVKEKGNEYVIEPLFDEMNNKIRG